MRDIQDRHDQLLDLEKKIEEIRDMFNEMGMMISLQVTFLFYQKCFYRALHLNNKFRHKQDVERQLVILIVYRLYFDFESSLRITIENVSVITFMIMPYFD